MVLLPQKQSDLGLHCLSRPFWLAASEQNLKHQPIVWLYLVYVAFVFKLLVLYTLILTIIHTVQSLYMALFGVHRNGFSRAN